MAVALNKYTYSLYAQYKAGGDWVEIKKGLTMDQIQYGRGVHEICPYHFDVTIIPSDATKIDFKMTGLADTGVSQRDLTIKTGNGAGTTISTATLQTSVTAYKDKYSLVYSDTDFSSGTAVDISFTIYFDYDPFVFTYNVYYGTDKTGSEAYSTLTKLIEKRSLQQVYSYLFEGKIDGTLSLLNTNSKLLVVITRSDVSTVSESEVYRGNIDLFTFGYRYCIEFTDYNYTGIQSKTDASARNYTFMLTLSSFYDNEYSPLYYRFESVNFDSTPSGVQHIDVTIKNSSGTTVFERTNLPVAPNGRLLNSTLDKYAIYDLGKVFTDNESYTVTMYHYETKKTVTGSYLSPTSLHIGGNPVWNKIEYGGKPTTIVTTRDMQQASQPTPNDKIGEWYFDMSNSTHGLGVAAGGIIYPGDNTNIKDFHFKKTASALCTDEIYTGIEMSTTNYIKLPNNYYKSNYEDLGFSSNVWAKSIFGSTKDLNNNIDTDDTANTCRTLYFKFFIETSHSTEVTLLDIYNSNMGSSSAIRCKMNINITAKTFTIVNVTTSSVLYTGTLDSTVTEGNWYTMLIVVNKGTVRYVNITNYTNYKQTTYSPGAGFGYNPGEDSNVSSTKRIASNKTGDTFGVTYTYTGTTGEVEIVPILTIYQYNESTDAISVNTKFTGISLTNSSTARTDTVSIDTGGYSVILGLKIGLAKGGTSLSGSLKITGITFNGVAIGGPFTVNSIDDGMISVFATITGSNMLGTSYTISKTESGSLPDSPIGGLWFTPNVDLSILVDTYVTKDNFTTTTDYVGLGDISLSNYGVIIGKVGMIKRTCSAAPDYKNPYEFMPASMMEILCEGYKLVPKLYITYDESSYNKTLGYYDIKELKAQQVIFNLPLDIHPGSCVFTLKVGSDSYYTKTMTIGHVKPDDASVDFDCDFENNFDSSLTIFKSRFYAKQKLWGGELGGGDNGNLIYSDKGNGCIVLEQHGDYYTGNIPCCEKQSGDYWYGGPAPILQLPLSSDGSTPMFYNSEYAPNPKKCRTIRTGGLIQSSDYYGYGTWDIWFKADKELDGAAICWWTFHYQELYVNDILYDFYLEQNVSKYFMGDKYSYFNYLYTVKSPGTENAYIIVNNEIDMEIGSEANQYTITGNPNEDGSLKFYLPVLDEHTVVGCNTVGDNYGLWMIDWDNSEPIIQERYNAINNISGDTFDSKTGDYLSVPCNNLKWIKISDTICDELCSGATTRSLRWNNWWTEADSGGLISMTQAINGKTGVAESSQVWDMGNTIGAATLRTPIGTFNKSASIVSERYIPTYISDGKYHKYTFIWHKDYTQIKIDDVIVKTNKAFVPFIPMPILLGCWFPSDNSWGTYAAKGLYGTWAGNKAQFDIKHVYVKRIKYTHFTETECARTNMLYHPETYPQDGLREIL